MELNQKHLVATNKVLERFQFYISPIFWAELVELICFLAWT